MTSRVLFFCVETCAKTHLYIMQKTSYFSLCTEKQYKPFVLYFPHQSLQH